MALSDSGNRKTALQLLEGYQFELAGSRLEEAVLRIIRKYCLNKQIHAKKVQRLITLLRMYAEKRNAQAIDAFRSAVIRDQLEFTQRHPVARSAVLESGLLMGAPIPGIFMPKQKWDAKVQIKKLCRGNRGKRKDKAKEMQAVVNVLNCLERKLGKKKGKAAIGNATGSWGGCAGVIAEMVSIFRENVKHHKMAAEKEEHPLVPVRAVRAVYALLSQKEIRRLVPEQPLPFPAAKSRIRQPIPSMETIKKYAT